MTFGNRLDVIERESVIIANIIVIVRYIVNNKDRSLNI